MTQQDIIAAICRELILQDDIDYITEEAAHEYLSPAIEDCGYKSYE